TAAAARAWSRSFVRVGESQQSIQEILVEQGQARVAAATRLSPISCCVQNGLRVPPGAVSGQTPISPLYGRNISTGLRPRGANFALVEARYCRCAKAAPQYI